MVILKELERQYEGADDGNNVPGNGIQNNHPSAPSGIGQDKRHVETVEYINESVTNG